MSATNNKVIMWDMAGTLIPFDTVTGRPRALPGCDDFLPELARDYRMVCTTGDSTAGARGLLESFEILVLIGRLRGMPKLQPVGRAAASPVGMKPPGNPTVDLFNRFLFPAVDLAM